MIKKLTLALACLGFMPLSYSQDVPSAQEISKQIIKKVTGYADAITCGDVKIEPSQVAALSPYTTEDNAGEARYAVIWSGDIGCNEGTASTTTNIAIVTVTSTGRFILDATKSSPSVQFDSAGTVEATLVSNTSDSLVMKGEKYGDHDATTSPSISVKYTLRADDKGNWHEVK